MHSFRGRRDVVEGSHLGDLRAPWIQSIGPERGSMRRSSGRGECKVEPEVPVVSILGDSLTEARTGFGQLGLLELYLSQLLPRFRRPRGPIDCLTRLRLR